MAHAPRPDAISIARLEVNFDGLGWVAATIRETNTGLATLGDRKYSSAGSSIKDDDELPPEFASVYVVKMSRAFREPVDTVRLGITPEQATHEAQGHSERLSAGFSGGLACS
jgi:hypothetical protein